MRCFVSLRNICLASNISNRKKYALFLSSLVPFNAIDGVNYVCANKRFVKAEDIECDAATGSVEQFCPAIHTVKLNNKRKSLSTRRNLVNEQQCNNFYEFLLLSHTGQYKQNATLCTYSSFFSDKPRCYCILIRIATQIPFYATTFFVHTHTHEG